MNSLKNTVALLLKDESGQGLIEYALIATLIGLAAVVTMTSLGSKISAQFASITTSL